MILLVLVEEQQMIVKWLEQSCYLRWEEWRLISEDTGLNLWDSAGTCVGCEEPYMHS